MTLPEFLEAVGSAGGQFYLRERELRFRMPKGTMTDELRAGWGAHRPTLQAWCKESWASQARWERYLAQHTILGFCASCAAEVQRWPWEDTATVLCLACARAELEGEDDPLARAVR